MAVGRKAWHGHDSVSVIELSLASAVLLSLSGRHTLRRVQCGYCHSSLCYDSYRWVMMIRRDTCHATSSEQSHYPSGRYFCTTRKATRSKPLQVRNTFPRCRSPVHVSNISHSQFKDRLTFLGKTVRNHNEDVQRQSQHPINPAAYPILDDLPFQTRHAREVCPNTCLEQTESPERHPFVFEQQRDQQTAARDADHDR